MSEAVSEERVKILAALGAEIEFTPAHLGTDGAIEHVYNLARENPERFWLADQFNNEANWMAHYEGTAMEIWEQTQGHLDAIVATMGTTGTLMGISRRFKELDPSVQDHRRGTLPGTQDPRAQEHEGIVSARHI